MPTWTFTPPVLVDGTFTVRVRQDDAAGHTRDSVARTFTLDRVPPVVTVVQPADGTRANDRTPALSGAAGDAVGDEDAVTVTLDGPGAPHELVSTRTGAAWESTSPPLPDGAYTVRASQRDRAGNVGISTPHVFTVDATAPQPTLDDPADGTDPTPTFTGTAGNATGDAQTVTVKVFDDTEALVTTLQATRTESSFTVDATQPLAPGTYTAQAEQDDDLGNGPGISAPQTFTLLRAAPDVTLTSPAAGRGSDSTPEFVVRPLLRPGDAGR